MDPALTPVTVTEVPDGEILAIPALPVIQVPPAVRSTSTVIPDWQTVVAPKMVPPALKTFTVTTAKQDGSVE